MKLLVTGGAGFIGANFIHYWLETHPDDSIVNYDALTYAGNLENLTSVAQAPNYHFVKGNICDAKAVAEVMHDIDTIVHFAAESHVDRSIATPYDFVNTNVLGTFVLLEAAREKNIHFHHVSTDEVFGSLALGSDDKFTPQTPYNPSSPYSASKAASDHLVRSYFHTYALPITISNCSNNFGPFQFPEKFIPLIITNALEGKKIPLYGNGQQVRDWLYVEDHCKAIDLILTKGKVGETYLIGGSTDDIPNYQVVKMILNLLEKPDSLIEYVTDRPGHDVRYAIDWSKAHDELGYMPQHAFGTYLEKTIAWYLENKQWWQRIKSGEYQAYYQAQYGDR
jgi:dTDP-glucose 4,6-dehydratase